MRVTATHLGLMVLAGICWTADLHLDWIMQLPPCPRNWKPGDPCGCGSFKSRISASAGWSGEDIEFYFIDDMAFRKPALTLSDSSSGKPDLKPLFWPGGLIFYVIDKSFKSSFQKEIEKAMSIIQNSVGKNHLEFRSARMPNGDICHGSYLKIQRTKKALCFAEIGGPRDSKATTELWLNQDSCSPGTIQHELLHSLGRFHEQSRPDRDQHVTLQLRNTNRRNCRNFRIFNRSTEDDPSFSLPYDVNSIMHYGSCFFSCTGHYTMVTKDGKKIEANRKAMTALDIQKVQMMYPANAKVSYSEPYCRSSSGVVPVCSVAGLFLSVTLGVAVRLQVL